MRNLPRMPFDALPSPPVIALAPRPWLSRGDGECAFPVDGESFHVRSCCNPCGPATYCPAHAALMRGPRAASADEMARFLKSVLR